jgi:glycine/D-amino acid oxidase-like deaminating enzyme
MAKEKIFWHDTVQMPVADALSSLPEKVEVAIIGGGYTGLSAARTLAKRGVRVAVLEAETLGWGASSRNGGMTLTGLKVSMHKALKIYGRETARRLFQSSLDSIDTVERIISEENINCGFARRGHLLVANKQKHYEALKDEVEFMSKEFSHKVCILAKNELQSEIGTDVFYGALMDESSGGLNPAQYVAGLAEAAKKAGATLAEHARVDHFERGPHGYALETRRGKVAAEKVLVATSGYTSHATPNLQRKIIPIGSFIIATEKLPTDLAAHLIPNQRMIFDSRHFLNYFRLWENRLIFGGRAAFFPENSNTVRQSAEILRREMIQVYPQLKNVKVEYAWGGTLDFAFDMMPHVGEMNGLYYSLGYAGHGVAMATYLGKTVAHAMMKGNLKDHPFASIPLPSAPLGLYNGFPWFLPFAELQQKILDWIQ